MGKVTGFKEYTREIPARRPVEERVHDYFEVYQPFPEEKVRVQAARCMDCGIPFCHTGCPVSNIIPDWNDLVYKITGKKPSAFCIPPIIFRSLPGASVPHPAKPLACWGSTSRR